MKAGWKCAAKAANTAKCRWAAAAFPPYAPTCRNGSRKAAKPPCSPATRANGWASAKIQNRLRDWAVKNGSPQHLSPHMMRHSYASHLLQSSGDIRAIQELLGHSNLSATQIYTKLDFDRLAQVYDRAHPRAETEERRRINPPASSTRTACSDGPNILQKHSANQLFFITAKRAMLFTPHSEAKNFDAAASPARG